MKLVFFSVTVRLFQPKGRHAMLGLDESTYRHRPRWLWQAVRMSVVLGVIVAGGVAADPSYSDQKGKEVAGGEQEINASAENNDIFQAKNRHLDGHPKHRLDATGENREVLPPSRCACGPKSMRQKDK